MAIDSQEQQEFQHPLRSQAFSFIWIGFTVSILGDHFFRVALTLDMADHGVFGLASLGMALALPTAIVGLVAGVFVDRYDRIRLLVSTDLVRCLLVALLGLLLIADGSSFAVTICLAVLLTFVSVVSTPALQATLPRIIADEPGDKGGGKRRLIAMDAWVLGALSVCGIVGPALAGVLLSWFEPGVLMLVDAATFAFCAVMVLCAGRRMPAPEPVAVPGGPRPSKLRAAGEGLRFLMRHPVLGPCFRTFPLMEFATGSIPFVLPLLLSATGSQGSEQYGFMLGALAVGRVLGMFLLNRTALANRRGAVLRYNFLIQGGAFVLVALTGGGWPALLAMAVAGIPAGAAQVAMSSYVQIEVEPQMRGRVFAALTSMVTWLAPFGPLLFVSLVGVISAPIAMAAIGAVVVAGGVRLFLCGPLARVQ
ncbi:MFS transporter [Nonomuraea angiospora]|uniref:MFS transporter n=1 Tax=Nonomuraea angiospora TaxID=46172 RepID=UPI0034470746